MFHNMYSIWGSFEEEFLRDVVLYLLALISTGVHTHTNTLAEIPQ